MTKTLCSTVLLFFLVSCTGCGFLTYSRITVNEPIKPEEVQFIVPGTTSLVDVVAQLGAPDELRGLKDGAIAIFHYRDSRYSRANFGVAGKYFLPVSPDFIISDNGLGADWFQVIVDPDWVVRKYAFSRHTDQSRIIPWPFRRNSSR